MLTVRVAAPTGDSEPDLRSLPDAPPKADGAGYLKTTSRRRGECMFLSDPSSSQLTLWINERYRRVLGEYVETGSHLSLGYALAMSDLAATLPGRANMDAAIMPDDDLVENLRAA